MGKETAEVLDYKHEDLDVFGTGQHEEPNVWHAVIRQAMIAGYIDKEIENYTSYSANHIKLIVFCYNNNIDFSSIKDPNIFWRTAKEETERKNGISINLRTMKLS